MQTPSPAPISESVAAEVATPARRPRGLVNEIVAELTASIRDGRLLPGNKLPTEAEIMARFSVSRTVVREAISGLQAAGWVETRHGVGSFVLEPGETRNFRIADADFAALSDVISLLELRISLETEAAGLAAQRRVDGNLEAMRAALQAFDASVQQDSDAVPPDLQFHMEVARASGNRHFADLLAHLGTKIIPRSRINTPEFGDEGRKAYLLRVNGEHESIYNAIRDRDAEAARAAMRTHLSNSRERLRKTQQAANG